jgi:hypothetical protein
VTLDVGLTEAVSDSDHRGAGKSVPHGNVDGMVGVGINVGCRVDKISKYAVDLMKS